MFLIKYKFILTEWKYMLVSWKKGDIIKIYFIEYKFVLIEWKYILISWKKRWYNENDSRTFAPRTIATQIIAHGTITSRTSTPQDNCLPNNCPPDNGPQKNWPRTFGAWIVAPPDNYSRVVSYLQVIAPQITATAPSWMPQIILSGKIFYKSFTENVFSFWARKFLSCIYLITVFDQLLLVLWYSNKIPIYRRKDKKIYLHISN